MVCSSICPLEAISLDEKTGEIKLDIEKCQVCGICSSACPASAIDAIHYDVGLLVNYVEKSMLETGLDKLVLVCQGASRLQSETKDELRKRGVNEFISVRLPCVGRVSPELLLRVLALGIKKIVVIQCEEGYCRFKEGSEIGIRRFLLTQTLLNQLGFVADTLTVIRSLIKVHIDKYRCIGCGNCVYICPYDAIKIVTPGVAQLNPDVCSGCGVCAAICPTLAIKLEGFEHESTAQLIASYGSLTCEMKSKSKKPVILVFCCQWSEFPALNEKQRSIEENVVLLEIPCSGAVDPLHILQAFRSGFDGVLVMACKENECKFEKGNEEAKLHISAIKRLLTQVNLGNRLEICFVSPKYLGEFDKHVKTFIEKLCSVHKSNDGEFEK